MTFRSWFYLFIILTIIPLTAYTQDTRTLVTGTNDAFIEKSLPDLSKINQPIKATTTTLNTNQQSVTPTFQKTFSDGTSVTEYRKKNQPTQISVKSGWGTRYHMERVCHQGDCLNMKNPVEQIPSIHFDY